MKPPAILSLFALAFAFVLHLCAPHLTALETPTLRVLFLGDNDIHQPRSRFEILRPVLADKGIEVVYTDDMRDINSAKLAGFDALLVYANITHIEAKAEAALLNFVDQGGGLVALHCASYCFHNSPKYIELVGAQFNRHGSGVFKETIVAPDHPVMKGLSAIESWDETYVHTKHNEKRTVLAERHDDEGKEPWTWVREHGKGRVFYTAWGHDERTWSNDGFQALVEGGIRWVSSDVPWRLKARTDLPEFEYMEAPAPMPNYTPNAQWGTEGEQITVMQKPLEPEQSSKHLRLLPGFEHSLYASEPDIFKPIWLSFDHRGRLWIAETKDYPNELQPENSGRDRLKIVEDTDGDGKADKFTVFADKLSVPTSFIFANGGVLVMHSGRIEWFADTDGDDMADTSKVLFSGWNMRDTHATASNFRYGFDNWIYGTVGYSGFEGEVGGKGIRFGQGIFRFRPDGSAMEFLRSTNNNTWGLSITEDNIILGSTANGNASMYMPIPNRYYEAVRGWSAARIESVADSQKFYAITKKIRQVDWHGMYTAGSGSGLYTARAFPQRFWNRGQLVAEPTGHLLGLFFVERRGADFVSHNARNFAASDDEWTSPIYGEIGPDGAVWMVDWYNYIIQHNPTPRGFETGKGNAYETPLRDKTHGRIYRITHKDGKLTEQPKLDPEDPKSLVAALTNDNMLWRMHAQRLLVERGNRDVVGDLIELVESQSRDAIGLSAGPLHALWTLHGLGALDADEGDAKAILAATIALKHPAASVRRGAVGVLPRTSATQAVILAADLLSDDDAQVRMATLLFLAESPSNDEAGAAIYQALKKSENHSDRWIPDAAAAAAAQHDAAFLTAVLGDKNAPVETFEVAQTVAGHYAAGAPTESVVDMLAAVSGASPELAATFLESIGANWPDDDAPELTDSDIAKLGRLMDELPETVRDRLLLLGQSWNDDLFADRYSSIVEALASKVKDGEAEPSERANAAGRWIRLADTNETANAVLGQISLVSSPQLGAGMLQALSASTERDTGNAILESWENFTPATRRSAIGTMMRRSSWAMSLLNAVENRTIDKGDLQPEHWTQLRRNPSRRVSRRARELAESSGGISPDREAVVEKLLPLAKQKGDAVRGKTVFTASCSVCHKFNGEGGQIGPELTGVAARGKEDILLEILDPNRSVEANYRLWTLSTKDGAVFAGRMESETQTAVELLDVAGQKHVVQRKDIQSLSAAPVSLMPTGFEALPADDLKALLEYLMTAEEHE